MNCPQCGAPVQIPKAAFYVAGASEAECPNGHAVPVTTEKGRELSADERARIARGTPGQGHPSARDRGRRSRGARLRRT